MPKKSEFMHDFCVFSKNPYKKASSFRSYININAWRIVASTVAVISNSVVVFLSRYTKSGTSDTEEAPENKVDRHIGPKIIERSEDQECRKSEISKSRGQIKMRGLYVGDIYRGVSYSY